MHSWHKTLSKSCQVCEPKGQYRSKRLNSTEQDGLVRLSLLDIGSKQSATAYDLLATGADSCDRVSWIPAHQHKVGPRCHVLYCLLQLGHNCLKHAQTLVFSPVQLSWVVEPKQSCQTNCTQLQLSWVESLRHVLALSRCKYMIRPTSITSPEND